MAASDKTLSDIHEEVGKSILQDIKDADLATRRAARADAIKFLKDNGYDCVVEKNPTMLSIVEKLPFADEG